MANPATLTVTALTLNGESAQPAGDTIDTDGTVPVAVSGERTIIVVTNLRAGNSLTVTIKGGANPPAFMGDTGDAAVTLGNSGVGVFGPFESGRFSQSAGGINVAFLGIGAAASPTVRTYKLPKA
jgi:hypothetical protein